MRRRSFLAAPTVLLSPSTAAAFELPIDSPTKLAAQLAAVLSQHYGGQWEPHIDLDAGVIAINRTALAADDPPVDPPEFLRLLRSLGYEGRRKYVSLCRTKTDLMGHAESSALVDLIEDMNERGAF